MRQRAQVVQCTFVKTYRLRSVIVKSDDEEHVLAITSVTWSPGRMLSSFNSLPRDDPQIDEPSHPEIRL